MAFMGDERELVDIQLVFKFDATYKTPVDGIVKSVAKVVTAVQKVLNAFESVKLVAMKVVNKILDLCCQVNDGVDRRSCGLEGPCL